MRRNYEMTAEDLAELMEACKPVPYILPNCGPIRSPQENANFAWRRLGERMGFDWRTAQPTGQGDRFFSAEPLPCKGIEIEPGVFSGCDGSGNDCPVCGE